MFYSSSVARVTIEAPLRVLPVSFFDGCKKLTYVDLPDTLEVISTGAFSDCVLLTSVLKESQSVKHVAATAFAGCRALEGVIIGTEDTEIGAGTYYGCDAITEVVIPDSIKMIGASAFASCVSLQSVTLPDSIEHIDSGAFASCAKLITLSLPTALKTIGDGAFSRCSRLIQIDIPKSVVYVGADTFSGTRWLRNIDDEFVVVGDGVLTAYTGDSANITIPETVKRIPDYRFASVTTEISTVTIPSSVEYISKEAFAKLVSSTDSSGNSTSSYQLRYLTIIARKGTYAETFANHEYYTFRELGK